MNEDMYRLCVVRSPWSGEYMVWSQVFVFDRSVEVVLETDDWGEALAVADLLNAGRDEDV